MIIEEEIIMFTIEETGEKEVNSETDIFNECRISGDDCTDFLNSYQKKYNVDISEYLWYFHHEEEGSWNFNFGNLFFKNPNQLVKEIPITPKMLAEFANLKKWEIDYPNHYLPKYRYDLIINSVLFFLIFCWLIYFLIKKYL